MDELKRKLEGKRVLVTGASGFIGSHLVFALVMQGNIDLYLTSMSVDLARPLFGRRVMDNYSFNDFAERVVACDLRDTDRVRHVVAVAQPDIVLHLAAVTQVTEAKHTPRYVMDVNVMGTLHLLEAVRDIAPNAVTIVASSDKAYGDPTHFDGLPLPEFVRLQPAHPYDASKACMDLLAQSFGRAYDMNIQITRMANVYGPQDTNWKRLIPGVGRWIARGEQPLIRSNGKKRRQYLFISDAIMGYLSLLNYTMPPYDGPVVSPAPWNFGPRTSHSVNEVVTMMRSEADRRGVVTKEPIVLDNADDETDDLAIDSSEAERRFGWTAQTSIQEGLSRTLEWLLESEGRHDG